MLDRRDFEHCATQLEAIADPLRWRILEFLFNEEMTLSSLSRAVGSHTKKTSYHLTVLCNAGLVQPRRIGRFMHYSPHPAAWKFGDDRRIKQINLGCCLLDFEAGGPLASLPS